MSRCVPEGSKVFAARHVRSPPQRFSWYRDDDVARRDARELGQGGFRVCHVLEDFDGENEIERTVGERQVGDVGKRRSQLE